MPMAENAAMNGLWFQTDSAICPKPVTL